MRRCSGRAALLALTAFAVAAALADLVRADYSTPAVTLQASTPEAEARLGYASASADVNNDHYDDVVVAAPYANYDGHVDCGEVVVWYGPSLESAAALHAPAPQDNSYFGWAVAADDFNGDGFGDVAAGSPYAVVGGHAAAGSVSVLFGPSFVDSLTIDNPQPAVNARFGFTLAAGDVNGDGVRDLLVGAPDAPVGDRDRAGRVFIFMAPTLSTSYELQAPQPETYAYFGRALGAGDVDNDGDEDVIVGSPDANVDGHSDAGLAFLFRSPGFDNVTTFRDPEPQAGAFFGRGVASGDFNRDGYDDLLISAYGSDIYPHPTAGEVFVFTAPSFGAPTVLREPVAELDAYFGFELTAADVNNDGYADAVIGVHDADAADFTATSGGEAYIFDGPSFPPPEHFQDPQPESFAYFARSVAVGDVNNDGFGDFIAGAPGSNVGAAGDAGQAFVFFADLDDPPSPPVGGYADAPEAALSDFGAHDGWSPHMAGGIAAAALLLTSTAFLLRRRHRRRI